MPAGGTHDRLTLWSLPAVTGLTLWMTGNTDLVLLVGGGYLFSGLMLSPDLDLRSRPYQRWGWFRWIWVPYQKMLRHRSIFSHGPIIGTTLRVVYLCFWLSVVVIVGLAVVRLFSDRPSSLPLLAQQLGRTLWTYRWQCLAFSIGLELSAILHAASDYTVSAYKQYKKSGEKKGKASRRKKGGKGQPRSKGKGPKQR